MEENGHFLLNSNVQNRHSYKFIFTGCASSLPHSTAFFFFRSGMKAIILYDLSTLFGLKPHGAEIDLAFDIDTFIQFCDHQEY